MPTLPLRISAPSPFALTVYWEFPPSFADNVCTGMAVPDLPEVYELHRYEVLILREAFQLFDPW